MRKKIFEHVSEPLLPTHLFLKRIGICTFLSLSMLVLASALGAWGFHAIENQPWIDSFLNAVMIMTGVGVEGAIQTDAGKLFTIVFSLLSPIVFYSTLVIFFTPILHRLLHHFHLDLEQGKD